MNCHFQKTNNRRTTWIVRWNEKTVSEMKKRSVKWKKLSFFKNERKTKNLKNSLIIHEQFLNCLWEQTKKLTIFYWTNIFCKRVETTKVFYSMNDFFEKKLVKRRLLFFEQAFGKTGCFKLKDCFYWTNNLLNF